VSGVFTGSGDLRRPTGPFPFNNVFAFGLTWDFFTVPATFGYELGLRRRYFDRMIELSALHIDGQNHEMVSDQFDAYAEGIYWVWREAAPERIHYEIIPGVSVVFHWLLFPDFP